MILYLFLFSFGLFPSGRATVNHLPPSNFILSILFSCTNQLYFLFLHTHKSSLWSSSRLSTLLSIYSLSFLCTCPNHLSLISLTPSPKYLMCAVLPMCSLSNPKRTSTCSATSSSGTLLSHTWHFSLPNVLADVSSSRPNSPSLDSL